MKLNLCTDNCVPFQFALLLTCLYDCSQHSACRLPPADDDDDNNNYNKNNIIQESLLVAVSRTHLSATKLILSRSCFSSPASLRLLSAGLGVS